MFMIIALIVLLGIIIAGVIGYYLDPTVEAAIIAREEYRQNLIVASKH